MIEDVYEQLILGLSFWNCQVNYTLLHKLFSYFERRKILIHCSNIVLSKTTCGFACAGTLLQGALLDHRSTIGLILGTGSNACYLERADRVYHWESERHGERDVSFQFYQLIELFLDIMQDFLFLYVCDLNRPLSRNGGPRALPRKILLIEIAQNDF